MKPKFTKEEKKLIGRRIRDARNAEKLTLEQLAEKCECSSKHIGDVERGTVSASWPLAVKIGTGDSRKLQGICSLGNVCFIRIFEVRCAQLLTFVLTFSIRFSLSGAAPLPGIRRSLPNVSSVLRLKNLYVGQI